MNVRFFNPALIYQKHKQEFDDAIGKVLSSGELILRGDVELFEKRLAEFTGARYAVGLNSGTDALYLSLWALGVGRGDDVLVPSHTFVATAQVVAQLGANPIMYDMGSTPNFTKNTKVIIPAHIAGEFETDMTLLMGEVRNRGIKVVEDACQALGAMQHSKMAGTWGETGCFSFYPAKILGAFGDAGGLVTNDKKIYEQVIELRNHYKSDYSKWGINSRLDNLQAAILNVRLQYIKDMLARRKEIAEYYLKNLIGVGLPTNTQGRVWQDFIIQVPNRDEVYVYLKEKGIETMKNEYPMPLGKLPNAEHYERTTLRIPCNDVLTDEEVKYVTETINSFGK